MLRSFIPCLFLGGASIAADADADAKALQGTWLIEAATFAGRDHTDDFKGMKLVIASDRFTIDFAENSDKGTFSLNAAKSPR